MHTTRRTLLRTAALALPVTALAACNTTPASLVTLTQTALSDASNVIAGLNATLGNVIPAATLAAIQNDVTNAEAVLALLVGKVGSLVPASSVQGVVTDLDQAAAAVAQYLPGNTYLEAVQVLLPVLAAAWRAAVPASAAPGTMTVAQARAVLSALPQPPMLKGV